MTPVAPDTTDDRALATGSVDRTRNGLTDDQDGTLVHIGAGVYLTAGHVFYQYANPDTVRPAESYTITVADGLDAQASFTIDAADFGTSFHNFGWGTEGGTDMAVVFGEEAGAPATALRAHADLNAMAGGISSFGYPASDGFDGATQVSIEGGLSQLNYRTLQTGNGPASVQVSDGGMEVVSGQSGSGIWLQGENGGNPEDHLIGIATLDIARSDGPAVGFEPISEIYMELGALLEARGYSADDFGRNVVTLRTNIGPEVGQLDGTLFHEDIFGGPAAETIFGGGGDDRIYNEGRGNLTYGGDGDDTILADADSYDLGNDTVFGGSGDDTITGLDGDVLSGGDGDDMLFGHGSTMSDGAGIDRMAGAAASTVAGQAVANPDTFVMAADNRSDIVDMFDTTNDLIDISAWGVLAFGDLAIENHRSGRVIVRFDREALVIDDGARGLRAADLTADAFVFASGTPPVEGTSGRDLLIGTDAGETFRDLGGVDRLYGKDGPDIFEMAADGDTDQIKDYQDGLDVIDVSAWGATGLDQMSVEQHSAGRIILRYADEILMLSPEAGALAPSDIDEGDFIFA